MYMVAPPDSEMHVVCLPPLTWSPKVQNSPTHFQYPAVRPVEFEYADQRSDRHGQLASFHPACLRQQSRDLEFVFADQRSR